MGLKETLHGCAIVLEGEANQLRGLVDREGSLEPVVEKLNQRVRSLAAEYGLHEPESQDMGVLEVFDGMKERIEETIALERFNEKQKVEELRILEENIRSFASDFDNFEPAEGVPVLTVFVQTREKVHRTVEVLEKRLLDLTGGEPSIRNLAQDNAKLARFLDCHFPGRECSPVEAAIRLLKAEGVSKEAYTRLQEELAQTKTKLGEVAADRDRWVERMRVLEKRHEAAAAALNGGKT